MHPSDNGMMNVPREHDELLVGDIPAILNRVTRILQFLNGIRHDDYGDHADVVVYFLESGWVNLEDLMGSTDEA